MVFPASAGMSPDRAPLPRRHERFPRQRGDEPNQCLCLGSGVTFSPPARG